MPLLEPSHDPSKEVDTLVVSQPTARASSDTPHTPRKSKRVRFSAPGQLTCIPEDTEQDDEDGEGDTDPLALSTGLTPHLKRTTLLPRCTPRRTPRRKNNGRRSTLPPRLGCKDSTSTLPCIEERQYAPLKQVLDHRLRRRLRRSHLSEEINDIAAHQREDERALKELVDLRGRREESETRVRELMFELETQRQFGINVNAQEEEKAEAMREELEKLRAELGVRDPSQGEETEYGSELDDAALVEATDLPSPASIKQEHASSPSPRHAPNNEVGTQTHSTPTVPLSTHTALVNAHATTAHDASTALEALSLIRTELQCLNFAAPDAPTEEILAAIQNLFHATRMDLERLIPGETPNGFDDARLLPALIAHIAILVDQLDEHRRASCAHAQSEAALRGHFTAALERNEHLENRMTVVLAGHEELKRTIGQKDRLVRDIELASQARVAVIDAKDDAIVRLKRELDAAEERLRAQEEAHLSLQSSHAANETSIERLRHALETYRSETVKLEGIIHSLDAQHKGAAGRVEELEKGCATLQEEKAALADRHERLRREKEETEAKLGEAKGFLVSCVGRWGRGFESVMGEQREVARCVGRFVGGL